MAIAAYGDPLKEIEGLLDWNLFLSRLAILSQSDTDRGGRPYLDEMVLIRLLVLQQWHGLSDYELEIIPGKRISFCHEASIELRPMFRMFRRSSSITGILVRSSVSQVSLDD